MLHLPPKNSPKTLMQELLDFASMTHFHDSYFSQILIIVDKRFP